MGENQEQVLYAHFNIAVTYTLWTSYHGSYIAVRKDILNDLLPVYTSNIAVMKPVDNTCIAINITPCNITHHI